MVSLSLVGAAELRGGGFHLSLLRASSCQNAAEVDKQIRLLPKVPQILHVTSHERKSDQLHLVATKRIEFANPELTEELCDGQDIIAVLPVPIWRRGRSPRPAAPGRSSLRAWGYSGASSDIGGFSTMTQEKISF
jgi:hypothetical protein